MAAPITSPHRNLQTHQPFYPALSNSTEKNVEYLVQTPINITPPTFSFGTIIGIKILDSSYAADGGRTTIITRKNRLAVTTDNIYWTPVSTPDNVDAAAVLNDPLTKNFILETTLGVLYTSPDGITWTLVDMNQSTDGFLELLSFAGEYLWATSYTRPANVSPSNNWNRLYTSTDGGITWTLVYELNGFDTPEGFRGIEYGPNLGVPF